IRPATLCGLSPRQRLDLTVNRFIASAYYQRRITVREPERRRPYVHMEDLVRLYLQILEADADSVRGAVFNVAYGNHTVGGMAQQIAAQVGAEVELRPEPFADGRSYRVSTQRLQRALRFAP